MEEFGIHNCFSMKRSHDKHSLAYCVWATTQQETSKTGLETNVRKKELKTSQGYRSILDPNAII